MSITFPAPSRLVGAALATVIVVSGWGWSERPAHAGVKLITLPPRERVEIQLDNMHATLVEEERIVPLAAGVNDVVFGWANTNVDRSTLQLRCLTTPENIAVLSTSFPPGENAVTWQVSAPAPISARVRISYIIGQLDKSFLYRATAAHDEKTLTLWQYIQLHNQANEAFGMAGMWPGFGERLERPIGVNETKRLLAARFDDVPIVKRYTADLSQHGYLDEGKRQLRVPMHYVIENQSRLGMGAFPLLPGKARIFQDDGRGTVAFIGEDWARFTPREESMELYLGVAKDIVVTRTIERRDAKRVMGRLYDYDVIVKYEIENFKDEAVELDLAESMTLLRREVRGDTGRPVEWQLQPTGTLTDVDAERSTGDRPLFHVTLPPRGADEKAVKQVHRLHVLIKNEW